MNGRASKSNSDWYSLSLSGDFSTGESVVAVS